VALVASIPVKRAKRVAGTA